MNENDRLLLNEGLMRLARISPGDAILVGDIFRSGTYPDHGTLADSVKNETPLPVEDDRMAAVMKFERILTWILAARNKRRDG